jgi:hypothetical protein
MLVLLKALFLFLAILVFMPAVFFILVGGFGKSFALTIDRNSWLAKTQVKWIKALVHKFLV